MIVRCWWPLQDCLRRLAPLPHMLLAASLAAGCAGLAHYPSTVLPASLAGVALILQIHAVALQFAAIAVLLPTLALAAVCGAQADGLMWLAAAAALLLGPAIDQLRRVPPLSAQHAAGRCAAWLALGLQFVLLALVDRPWLLAGVVLLVVIGCAIIPAAVLSLDQRPPPGPTPFTPAAAPGRGWAFAGLALIATDIALPRPPVFSELTWLPWCAPLIWLGLAQRPWPVLGCGIAMAAVVIRHGPQAIDGDLMLGHLPPLLLWLACEPQRGPRASALAATHALLIAMTLANPRWGSAALLAGIMTLWIALRPRLEPIASARNLKQHVLHGAHRQPPSWRWYHVMKWRTDPIYTVLQHDAREWKSVLDIGAGSGLVTSLAAARRDVTSYDGVDLDVDKLHVAHHWLAQGQLDSRSFQLHVAHAPLDPEPTQRYDTIFFIDVLHYWNLDQQVALLEQAVRLLQPDGRIYIRDGRTNTDGHAGRVEQGERFTTWIGLNPRNQPTFLSEDLFNQLIDICQLECETEQPCGGDNFLWVLRVRVGRS